MKLLILVSGSGSNAEAIINSLKGCNVEITIGCNRKSAGVWQRGLKVPIVHVPSPGDDFSALEKLFTENQYDLVVLAGYMRAIPPHVLEIMPPAINIHPSLLPKYKGSEDGYADAIQHGDTETGLTIHYVTEDVDGGPALLQAAYDIPQKIAEMAGVNTDSAIKELKKVGLPIEHVFYPAMVKSLLFDIPLDHDGLCNAAEEKVHEQGYEVDVWTQ